MRVLLTGASGFIGGHLAAALASTGHHVVPLSRRHGVDIARLSTPAAWRPLLQGIDAAVNAAGIIGETRSQRFETLHTRAPVALFQACAEAGVHRVVQISALGADERAFSAYHRSKRAADEALRGLPLQWFVLRPSLVQGPGGTSARLFALLARLPLVPVIGDGQQRIQPVHVDDVVETVLRCLTSEPARLTLDVVGPEVFTFAGWLQRLRAAQGLAPARLLHVPYGAALALAGLGGALSPMLRAENLRMLQAGNCADAWPLAQFIGRAPKESA